MSVLAASGGVDVVSATNTAPYCGGLARVGDLRFAAHYSRYKAPLKCKHKVGSEAPRIYECDRATAKCYSPGPKSTYEFPIIPSDFNCLITYSASPIDPSDPAGWEALAVRPDIPNVNRAGEGRWVAAPGSNASVPAGSIAPYTMDSSMEALMLDDAAMRSLQNFVHPVLPTAPSLDDVPPLEHVISQLMQPPEVRLILPSGGLGLPHTQSSLFSRVFTSLRSGAEQQEPVEEVIGNTPDMLLTASEYLRQIPLMEVEYVPVEILVPTVTQAEVAQRRKEWEAWLKATNEISNATGVSVDADTVATVQENMNVMDSYIALQDSLRRYRLMFPEYLHTLLSYVEQSNEYFRTSWVEENARRLTDWYTAYSQYLPGLRSTIRALHQSATSMTADCLIPSCRMSAVPVKPGTDPRDFLGADADKILKDTPQGNPRAWLPRGIPLWEKQHGRRVLWHPLTVVGSPLPDLTFDFSDVRLEQVIKVPVLVPEKHPLHIPPPPSLDPATFADDVAPLVRLHPPLVEFPTLSLPDPSAEFLLVPEPPRLLPFWQQLIQWRTDRLNHLRAVCDASGSPSTFLVSEYELKDDKHDRDPAGVRAVTLVSGGNPPSILPAPSVLWENAPDLYSSSSLTWPLFCQDCITLRPQRRITQHISLDHSWGALQDTLLKAVDTWNAQVKFHSIIEPNEIR